MKAELRAIRRAVLVAAVVMGGCSFKDKGIDTTHSVEVDADELGGTGGAGKGGSGGGAGTGGIRLDGSANFGDASPPPPPPPPGDAAVPPDLGADAPSLPIGASCSSDPACGSGFCVDSVCCDQRCGDPCHSCSGMTTGAAPGLCKPDVANTVCGTASCMGSTHTPAPRCDGSGACTPRPAAACASNLTCASATACRTRCAADSECTGGMVCDVAAGTCRPPGKPNGQVCAAGTECSSGNCADKVCCDVACTGVCRACVMAQTGKPDGTCANLMAGAKDTRCVVQDPGTCGRDGTCDAGGHCHLYPAGTHCATECCRDGGGGNPRVCSYECSGAGTCDRTHPTIIDRCEGAQCCCPTGGQGGVAACTFPLGCPVGTCVM